MAQNVLTECLGVDFARLPEVVQRAHQGQINLVGIVAVERGTGICALIGAIMKLPPAARACLMTVHGEHLPDRMIWRRDFAGRRLESNFSMAGAYLVEAMGPLRLRLKPEVAGGALHYRLVDVRLGPITLPSWLAPRLTAWESEHGDHYEFNVNIELPLLGRLVRYGGLLELVAREESA